jgi:hypothetical protein
VTSPKRALFPLLILAALFASGCLWGVVRDARTGAPIAGASVSFRDSRGLTAKTVTNSDGWYAFDLSRGPVPAPGQVDFTVTATGYQTLDTRRGALYDDNAEGTWEVQSFDLVASDISVPGPPSSG